MPSYPGLSEKSITKLLHTQNAWARIVTRKYERRGVTQSLKNLHCLPIKWRIDFKNAVTTYKLITTGHPQYLSSRIERYSRTMRRSHRNVNVKDNSLRLAVPVTKSINSTRAFWSAAPDFGTNCRMILSNHLLYRLSETNLKRTIFGQLFNIWLFPRLRFAKIGWLLLRVTNRL